MIDFKLTGDGQVLAGLVRAEGEAVRRVRETVVVQTLKLSRHIKEQKLTGQVLKVRTGTLRRSIGHTIDDTGSAITGQVSTPVKYAPLHEFGGTVKARIVEAKRAKALRFQVGGKTVFAKRVSIPAVKFPERSFMRNALADLALETTRALQHAADAGSVKL